MGQLEHRTAIALFITALVFWGAAGRLNGCPDRDHDAVVEAVDNDHHTADDSPLSPVPFIHCTPLFLSIAPGALFEPFRLFDSSRGVPFHLSMDTVIIPIVRGML